MRLGIRVTGLDRLQRQLEKLGRGWPPEIVRGADAALRYVWSQVPPYPPKPAPGTASKFWTAKQRRWFWWALRAGHITGTYRRTGTLGRTLTVERGRAEGALGEVRTLADQIQIVAGSAIPYAEVVVGVHQAPVHQGRWWKLTQVVKGALGGVTHILQEAADRALKNIFKGRG